MDYYQPEAYIFYIPGSINFKFLASIKIIIYLWFSPYLLRREGVVPVLLLNEGILLHLVEFLMREIPLQEPNRTIGLIQAMQSSLTTDSCTNMEGGGLNGSYRGTDH